MDSRVDDATRIDRIGLLEQVKAAAAAAQATDAVDLDASVRDRHAAMGVPSRRQGQGVEAQIALARRESPNKGGRLLGLAKALTEMPHTLARMREGVLSEWRATILARETAYLTRADREAVDAEICSDPATFEDWGDARFDTEARRLAYKMAPELVVERNTYARTQRRVSSRAAPDSMAHFGALLPMEQSIAMIKALRDAASRRIAMGDNRTRSQIEADLLVERVTGQSTASDVGITVNLIMSDDTLFGGSAEPAHYQGHGPVPSAVARRIVKDAGEHEGRLWPRKIYADPDTGDLTNMESKARLFPKGLADLIDLRDDLCRTPYCGAPIRHRDHVTPHAEGGPTSAENGDGLCEACNHAKQAPGWNAKPVDGDRHTIEITTPTGHTYTSTAPPLRT